MTTMDVQLTHDSPTPDETPYSYAGDDHLSEAEVVQSGWWSRAVKLSGKEKIKCQDCLRLHRRNDSNILTCIYARRI